MSSPPPTDWSFEPTDAVDADGRAQVVPWSPAMDAPIAIDVSPLLADAEVPSNVVATIWRLKAYAEADHADQTSETTLPGDPVVSGTQVSQRVKSLARGRVYRLFFAFGPAGNVRQVSTVIDVTDTGT